jgi:aspartate-semialdehyde dehydrogenase
MEELLQGTAAKLANEPVNNNVFIYPLPFNIIPHIDRFQDNGYTKEEMKVVWETQKIFGLTEEEVKISCTAVRIPTLRAHAESITLQTVSVINPVDIRYGRYLETHFIDLMNKLLKGNAVQRSRSLGS